MNSWFEKFILASIMGNCLLLIIDPESETEQAMVVEWILLVIFTIEMILKSIAMGFVLTEGTYLRDAWNILDFLVVTIGWSGMFSDGQNISFIRIIRVLRPLRTVNSLPELKLLVSTII